MEVVRGLINPPKPHIIVRFFCFRSVPDIALPEGRCRKNKLLRVITAEALKIILGHCSAPDLSALCLTFIRSAPVKRLPKVDMVISEKPGTE